MKNHWELLKNQMLKKMKAQPIFKRIINSLLEKSGEYTRVAKAAMRKMKKVEEDYKSLLIRYREAKCEIETLNGELPEAYTKVRFLE